jgi:phage terminase large subunit-like protein
MGQAGSRAKYIKRAAPKRLPASAEPHPWDEPGLSRAEKVVRFIESLPCSSGFLAGTKFQLRPWQREFVEAVYATGAANAAGGGTNEPPPIKKLNETNDKKSGGGTNVPGGAANAAPRRLVRTAVLSVGRANGKTGLAACLALCHLAGPEAVERGEVYSAANDRWQAGRIFSEMCAMVERVPWLAARVTVRRGVKELEDIGGTGSFYAALSRESGTKMGLSPTCVIYDEYGQTETSDLFEALNNAMSKRRSPLMLVISTQAAHDHAPMSQLIDYGLRIQRGEVEDPTFHLALYTAPPDADPWVESTWRLANPALGDFCSLEDVQRKSLQAQRMPASEPSFRNLVLNQRVDASPQFLNLQLWKACGQECGRKELPYSCYAGLDLGATRDMTALVLVFARPDGTFDAVPHCWLPGETLGEREDEDRMPYKLWARQGYLQTFPGRSTDPKAVALKIAELHGQFKIKQLAFDRWRIEDLRRELDDIGCNVELVPFGQGFKDMGPSIDVVERLVETQKLRHGNHPVLTMAASNARIETDAVNNRKLSKKRSNGRIDALVALTMALGIATRHVEQHAVTPVAVWV